MKRHSFHNQKFVDIQDVRIYCARRGGSKLTDKFNEFIRSKPGLTKRGNFFIMESDFDEFKRQIE